LHAIRVSTHPLFIDRERMHLLARYRVQTVELGVQSTDPEVLNMSGRDCALNELHGAVECIRSHNMQLGLQLMPGLPGDTVFTFQKSVDDVIALRPQLVRIYPAVVIKHTAMHEMYRQQRFVPWDMETTIDSLKTAVVKFNRAGIPVARIGLHPDPSFLQNYVAGPHHPAMRHLVDSRICLEEMISCIKRLDPLPENLLFKVPPRRVSVYTGNKRENIYTLKDMFGLKDVKVRAEEGLAVMELLAPGRHQTGQLLDAGLADSVS
jgi:histone acetyltransferase (RNA polymerase elongator complex component)